jgi:hypothetical protein
MLPKERAEIEQLIGRLIGEGERASLRDLNSLPGELQEDLERLAPLQRAIYLRFLVSPEDHRFLKRFAADVFDGGIDAANWQRGGALFPRFTEGELLRLEISEILAPLRWVEGESWWRKQPLVRQCRFSSPKSRLRNRKSRLGDGSLRASHSGRGPRADFSACPPWRKFFSARDSKEYL